MRNGYLALPSALLIASGLALLAPGLAGAAGGRFLARFVERAWDEPLRKATSPSSPTRGRGRISVFLDSYFFTAATLAGSVLLLLIFQLTRGLPFRQQITALASRSVAAAGLWASLRSLRIRRQLAELAISPLAARACWTGLTSSDSIYPSIDGLGSCCPDVGL